MTGNTPWPPRPGKDGNHLSGMEKNISGFLIQSELGFELISKSKLGELLFITTGVNIIIWETRNVGWMIMNKEECSWLGIGIKGTMSPCRSIAFRHEMLLIYSVAYIDEKVTMGDH